MSKWLIMFAGGWVISFTGMKNLRFLFERRRWMAPNYNGDAIPLGYGLVFWIALVWFVFCEPASVWLIGPSIIVSFAGWLDDRIGQSRMKGLRGHFGILWREGRITTGMLKVWIIGSCAAGVAFLESDTVSSFITDVLLLALSANFINLLDVRPGRALKGFWFLLLLCVTVGSVHDTEMPFFLYLFMCTIVAAPSDFSARAMLGDTGANLLGFLGGALCVYSLSPMVKWLIVAWLIILHVYTERVSLTTVIEQNALLRWIDRWGRS
ncbi:hypothetical protein [Aneurinibacillus aneurinilyticus]|jgi:UDP-N-acetylmuramyl pentapeptide phosphotransferase/UDP-N-acetylglucosamine-1-phosphate transferase|uniref:Uncharacterized protein n=2 Tax=Aneurinibacillus aneurinilyticus TaxID=1391 RepID=A0A848CP02_ANEAE|nr:hypothetical protein [Aneurinibacillus aneurinilyticus]ERI05911.1 hypothetical protein HMPREF0083_05473 [Aneurinibacillus aneurinilyticus ATCC 12856]MCI1692665.1 hypothetical protein [Aneurinibacillus aneurinilyticus]MED0672746.1 hypothetical protein [Aneurinibacillus aneurinilyticus]MED0708573.1 hypothetical protein [Aneurinibacillus aneurinilyticus]MED0721733.1 hypothetical protein [Aneurinibacillus aneurinilyticus]